MLTIILVLTGVALGAGLLIYVINRWITNKVKGLERANEISKILPGINCGACGYASCFAYAQALTEPKALSCCGQGSDDDVFSKSPCATLLNDPEAVKKLEEALGVKLDLSALGRKALIRCIGNSEVMYDYTGIETCKGTTQLLKGYRKCYYSCLGFGDCQKICPQDAVLIDEEKHIAVIDAEKCNGCGLCVAECPQNLIELVSDTTKVAYSCNYELLRDIPVREKCDFGCIHCRKCFKACEEEGIYAIEWDKEKARPIINQDKCTLCGSCIKICPQNTLAYFHKVQDLSLQSKVPVGV